MRTGGFKLPKITPPQQSKKAKRLQATRKAQLKSVVGDITGIAQAEVTRLGDLLNDLLTDEESNPIVLGEIQEDDDQQEEISI